MSPLISGHNGSTVASPQTSIKYAGVPWEMGLTEANQILTLNPVSYGCSPSCARMAVSAQAGTLATAAMMGAEEIAIGTAALVVAMGCIMVRQCHSNTCPVGVCTQDENLRANFFGSAEKGRQSLPAS